VRAEALERARELLVILGVVHAAELRDLRRAMVLRG